MTDDHENGSATVSLRAGGIEAPLVTALQEDRVFDPRRSGLLVLHKDVLQDVHKRWERSSGNGRERAQLTRPEYVISMTLSNHRDHDELPITQSREEIADALSQAAGVDFAVSHRYREVAPGKLRFEARFGDNREAAEHVLDLLSREGYRTQDLGQCDVMTFSVRPMYRPEHGNQEAEPVITHYRLVCNAPEDLQAQRKALGVLRSEVDKRFNVVDCPYGGKEFCAEYLAGERDNVLIREHIPRAGGRLGAYEHYGSLNMIVAEEAAERNGAAIKDARNTGDDGPPTQRWR